MAGHRQVIIWTDDGLVHLCIYASVGYLGVRGEMGGTGLRVQIWAVSA